MEKTVKILVVFFAIVTLGLLGYHWYGRWRSRPVAHPVDQEKQQLLDKIVQLESEINRLTEEKQEPTQPQPGDEEMVNVFGAEKPAAPPAAPDEVDCKKITAQVVAFFQYLDSKSYQLKPGASLRSEELFAQISRLISARVPVNTGEMEDLHSLVSNATHFYRVLGKDRVLLIKEIIRNESTVLEPAMAVLFTWCTLCNDGASDQPSLETLYRYAHYFLETLGGRSYLLRREPKLRLLIHYYCLLVIDKANDQKINTFGLDIRPHLDYIFYDINNQKGLMYRQRYLSRLSALQSKYP